MSYSILTTKYVKIADTNHQIKLVAANNIQNSIEVKVFGLILNVGKSVNCYRLGLALGLINPYSIQTRKQKFLNSMSKQWNIVKTNPNSNQAYLSLI